MIYTHECICLCISTNILECTTCNILHVLCTCYALRLPDNGSGPVLQEDPALIWSYAVDLFWSGPAIPEWAAGAMHLASTARLSSLAHMRRDARYKVICQSRGGEARAHCPPGRRSESEGWGRLYALCARAVRAVPRAAYVMPRHVCAPRTP